MIQKIKEKIKKYWKHITGLIIGTALAAPLALPPENTTYRLEWKEAYDMISCKEDYVCNKNAYLTAFAKNPEYFAQTEEIAGRQGTYTLLFWKEFPASTTIQALDSLVASRAGDNLAAGLKMKTLYGTWYESYPRETFHSTFKDYEKGIRPVTGITGKLFAFLFNSAYSAVPIDSLESCAVTDLASCNGGTNWSGAWGNVDACNTTDFVVVSTPVQGGSRAAKHNYSADVACTRGFTAESTNDVVFTFYIRQDGTTGSRTMAYNKTGSAAAAMRNSSTNLQALNIGTWDTVATFAADTWYQIDIKITSFTSYTWQIQIDGGGYSANKGFNTNNTSVDDFGQIGTGAAGGNFYWDTIGPGADPPPAAAPIKRPDVIDFGDE